MNDDSVRDERLAAAGWQIGDAAEFLGMTPQEAGTLGIRFGLMKALRDYRRRSGLTQPEVAARIGSGEARIARMENGDGKATIDLLLRALMAVGATLQDISGVFARAAEVSVSPSQTK